MAFSSAAFLFLLTPAATGIYYLLIKANIKIRNIWLLIVSILFYAWGGYKYLFLIIASIIVNYLFGRWVGKHQGTKKGKLLVALDCIYNIGILFVFKYLNWILSGFGVTGVEWLDNLALPIGISFYTFQALSYVVDVYRKRTEPQKNILDLGLYIAFFPQLIAGPIVKYDQIADQLAERTHSWDKFADGVWRFIIGFSKKIILADQLAYVVEKGFGGGNGKMSVAFTWLVALANVFQIYFDFSGYSDMAVGLGKMFGFEIPENFDYPYISKSVSEFWRRWHMTLGSWFRDYLYFPLNFGPLVKLRKWLAKHTRLSKAAGAAIASFISFLVIWTLTGVWHGANLTYLIWGFGTSLILFAEQYKKPSKHKKLDAAIGWLYTFLYFIFMCVLLTSTSVADAFEYAKYMFGLKGNPFVDNLFLYYLGEYKLFFIGGLIFSFPTTRLIRGFFEKHNLKKTYGVISFICMTALLFISVSYVFAGSFSPFIYFNF